jgi:hypothetical protein
VDVYGVSVSTVLGGMALGFEASYRPRAPTPVADALPFLFAQTPGVPIEVSGFRREKRWMFIANSLYLAGPATPLLGPFMGFIGAEDMTLIGEIAMVSYPDLTDRVVYAVPIGVTQSAPGGFFPGANTRLEKRSWGYQLRISATYSRAFGTAITLTPAIAFRHDVDGVTPDFGVQFNEDLKQVALQLQADYLSRWTGLVTYSNSEVDRPRHLLELVGRRPRQRQQRPRLPAVQHLVFLLMPGMPRSRTNRATEVGWT